MASINGISLRDVHEWEGPAGWLSRGYIYLDGKKIGFWTMDGDGGEEDFSFYDRISRAKFSECVRRLHPQPRVISYGEDSVEVEYDEKGLMQEILELMDWEKFYDEAVKNGRDGVFLATDGDRICHWGIPKGTDENTFRTLFDGQLKDAEKDFAKTREHRTFFFTDSSQFDIGKKINLEDILDDDLNGLQNNTADAFEKKTLVEEPEKYPKLISETVAYTGGNCNFVEYTVEIMEDEGLSKIFIRSSTDFDYSPMISMVGILSCVIDEGEYGRPDLEKNWETGPLAEIIREVISQQEDLDNGCYKCKHSYKQEDTVVVKDESVYMESIEIIWNGKKQRYGCLVDRKTGEHGYDPVLINETRM